MKRAFEIGDRITVNNATTTFYHPQQVRLI